jgi:hypothetical protein
VATHGQRVERPERIGERWTQVACEERSCLLERDARRACSGTSTFEKQAHVFVAQHLRDLFRAEGWLPALDAPQIESRAEDEYGGGNKLAGPLSLEGGWNVEHGGGRTHARERSTDVGGLPNTPVESFRMRASRLRCRTKRLPLRASSRRCSST